MMTYSDAVCVVNCLHAWVVQDFLHVQQLLVVVTFAAKQREGKRTERPNIESEFVECGCQEPCIHFCKIDSFTKQSSSFCYLCRLFLVADPLGLSNAPQTAYKD
jgi:hypothetical protein